MFDDFRTREVEENECLCSMWFVPMSSSNVSSKVSNSCSNILLFSVIFSLKMRGSGLCNSSTMVSVCDEIVYVA